MISLKSIHLEFKDKLIFNDFSIDIPAEEKIVLKGDSGTGKTSLLNIIMGFIVPDKGDVIIDKEKLTGNNIRKLRRKISWLPQNLSVLGRGLISEIISLPFERFHGNRSMMPTESMILEHFDQTGLDRRLYYERFEKASGGEKQRIGLIICKLLNTPILLLDEPTSALDKTSKDLVIDYILKGNEQTIVSCSHDSDWVDACERVFPLEGGENV